MYRSFVASACAAPTITELKTQKPHETDPGISPRTPAWWPGGRTTQSAWRAWLALTASMAATTAPAARRAAAYEPGESRVSEVVGSLSACAPRACWTIGVSGTGELGGLAAMREAATRTIET